MRILFVTMHVPPPFGGMEVWLVSLIRGLAGDHVLGLVHPGERPSDAVLAAGIDRSYRIQSADCLTEASRDRVSRQVGDFVRDFAPDVVHLSQAGLSFLTPMLSMLGAPVVVSTHATDLTRTALWDRRSTNRPALLRTGLRTATRVASVSRFTRGLARAAGADEPIECIPPAVDTDRFAPGSRDEARRSLGLPLDEPVLLSVGRLVPRKGHIAVVRALESLDPKPVYAIAGIGPERETIERVARRARVEDRLRLLGEVPDELLPALYRAADLFVLPIFDRPTREGLDCEGFGIVFLEAAAAGLPVIAGRAGGVPDAIIDGETGILVEPNDDIALTRAIASLLGDRERAAEMGAAGRRRVRREFTTRAIVERYTRLYTQCVEESQPSPIGR